MEPTKSNIHPLKGHYSILIRNGASQQEIDQTIWSAFKSGSRQAFDYIYESYVRSLYRYGGKITPNRAVLEDCIQELFIEIWNKKELLNDTDSIKFYLFKSLRLKIARQLNQEKRLGEKMVLSETEHAEVEFSCEFKLIQEQLSQIQKKHLDAALSTLAKRQREAIYLRFYENMSYEQIALVMNLHLRSTYNLVSKALDSLREALKHASKHLFATLCLLFDTLL